MKVGPTVDSLLLSPREGRPIWGDRVRDLSVAIQSAWSRGCLQARVSRSAERTPSRCSGPQFVPWPFYHSHLVMAGGGGRKSGRKGEGEEGRIHFNLSLAPVTCSVGTVSPHCHQTLRFPFVLRRTPPPSPRGSLPDQLGHSSWHHIRGRGGQSTGL